MNHINYIDIFNSKNHIVIEYHNIILGHLDDLNKTRNKSVRQWKRQVSQWFNTVFGILLWAVYQPFALDNAIKN